MGTFLTAIGVGLVIVTLFETDILPCGIMISEDKSIEFVTAFTMEFLTICIIPVAMRLLTMWATVLLGMAKPRPSTAASPS